MDIYFRRMNHSDIDSVKRLIDKTLLHKSMQKVYEPSEIAIWDSIYDIDNLRRIVENSHAYLLFDKDSDQLLASGYIGLNNKHSAHIGMIFTDPDVRNLGLGKKIVEVLEQDEYAKIVEKIELSSSLSAYKFYRKLGYSCKDNEYQIEVDESTDTYSVPLEKYVEDIEKTALQ